jgi:transcriptional regulator GlxA family with amidase domain
MHTIAVLAYDGISPFHLSVPGIVFSDDLLKLSTPRYNLHVCAERIGPIRTLSGFNIDVRYDLSAVEQADTVIIPSWSAPDDIPQKALIDALVEAKARGARIVGLCLGTFVLAYAGLLEKRTVSTHWAWADDFQKAYPDVRLDADALYSDEGDIITSAGTAAAIDCCLHILRKDQGAEIANRVARRLVVAPYRHGGQSQYIEMPKSDLIRTDGLSNAMDWALAHLNETITVDVLANRANMSRRSFTRHFRQKTGTTLAGNRRLFSREYRQYGRLWLNGFIQASVRENILCVPCNLSQTFQKHKTSDYDLTAYTPFTDVNGIVIGAGFREFAKCIPTTE